MKPLICQIGGIVIVLLKILDLCFAFTGLLRLVDQLVQILVHDDIRIGILCTGGQQQHRHCRCKKSHLFHVLYSFASQYTIIRRKLQFTMDMIPQRNTSSIHREVNKM